MMQEFQSKPPGAGHRRWWSASTRVPGAATLQHRQGRGRPAQERAGRRRGAAGGRPRQGICGGCEGDGTGPARHDLPHPSRTWSSACLRRRCPKSTTAPSRSRPSPARRAPAPSWPLSATIADVDAVGACIGARGARVASIVDELGGEKIDIVEYSDDPAKFIASALSPADGPLRGARRRTVRIPAASPCRISQLSLAIGNKGQNARLAAKLTGWKIDIKPESGFYGREMQSPRPRRSLPPSRNRRRPRRNKRPNGRKFRTGVHPVRIIGIGCGCRTRGKQGNGAARPTDGCTHGCKSAGEGFPKPRLFSYRFISVRLRNHSREGRCVQMHQKRVPLACAPDVGRASRKRNWSGWSVHRKGDLPGPDGQKARARRLCLQERGLPPGGAKSEAIGTSLLLPDSRTRSTTVWRRRSENE